MIFTGGLLFSLQVQHKELIALHRKKTFLPNTFCPLLIIHRIKFILLIAGWLLAVGSDVPCLYVSECSTGQTVTHTESHLPEEELGEDVGFL